MAVVIDSLKGSTVIGSTAARTGCSLNLLFVSSSAQGVLSGRLAEVAQQCSFGGFLLQRETAISFIKK